MKVTSININNSSLQLFKECPYKFKKRCIDQQITREDKEAADFGSAVHGFIEGIIKDPGAQVDKLMRDEYDKRTFDPGGMYTFTNLARICRSYVRKYMNSSGEDIFYPVARDSNNKPLVEVYLEHTIDKEQNITINGTLDRIGQTEGGRIFLFDTKTSSAPSYWTKSGGLQLHTSPQFSHYSYLMSQHGYNPEFCVVDLIGTNPRYPSLSREVTTRSPERLAYWVADLRHTLNYLKWCIENDVFIRNMNVSPCGNYGGCELLKHCYEPQKDELQYIKCKPKGFSYEFTD